MTFQQIARQVGKRVRFVSLALLTPLLEKNPSKTRVSRCHVPVVLSMTRVVVLLFALSLLDQVERAGVVGWPEATLCMAIVLALPMLNALERVKPEQAAGLMKAVVEKAGSGGPRSIVTLFPREEPGKHDDHRDDADAPVRALS